jgi:archaellum component FlaF (FlaF/FlaG flagellin family)
MGFGTSGSALVIFTGLFLAVGTLYTATANVTESIHDAGEDQREQRLAAQETHVEIANATWNGTSENLTVAVDNTGETALSVEYTDVVVDGTYVPVEAFERQTVDDRTTDTWRPGGRLVLKDGDTVAGFDGAPERVKVVTETGVADVSEVTAA